MFIKKKYYAFCVFGLADLESSLVAVVGSINNFAGLLGLEYRKVDSITKNAPVMKGLYTRIKKM